MDSQAPVRRREFLKYAGPLVASGMAGLYSRPAGAMGPLTAADVILKGEERFRSLVDYHCNVDIVTKLGSEIQSGSGQFWFKQPRMLRVRILQGVGKGSEVAVDSRGQIRGRKRGLLSFIVKKLKASDRRLSTIRGTSMMELDWGSFFLRYHAAALRPDAAITLAPPPDSSSPYRVVITYPDLGKSMRETYSLDPREWVIVEGALREDDVLVEHVVFRDIRLNPGLPDSFFKL